MFVSNVSKNIDNNRKNFIIELLSSGKEMNGNSWVKKTIMGIDDSAHGVTYRLDKTE